jgi:adenylate cyclase
VDFPIQTFGGTKNFLPQALAAWEERAEAEEKWRVSLLRGLPQMPADQAPRRKLAAILSADVAGYSRLMGEDETATLGTLNSSREVFRQRIAQHQGRLVDTAGDSVLAIFESVVEAVQCATDVQQALHARNQALPPTRQMAFRMGVNLGDVIEQGDGSIYGDSVNVAARLQALADPGEICLSGTAYDQVKYKIALTFDYLGEKSVKNITDPVRVYRVRPETQDAAHRARLRGSARFTRRKALIAAAVALLVVAGALGVWQYASHQGAPPPQGVAGPAPALALPNKPSIAVLPFVNMSADPQQEYFSDGMTEELITGLSKRSGLFVIARNSVFTYKGRPVKPEQVSRELGVRYVLEGSVRKVENRVRITAQLIDATTGYHVWAETYDGELQDVFALQDGITRQIVAALAPQLTAGEPSRSGRQGTQSIEAYDDFLRGITLYYEFSKEANALARQRFERAIAVDPSYARAYMWLSWTHFVDWEFQWTGGPGGLDWSLEAARKAVALDDALSEAHTILGWDLLWKKQHEVAIAELERAVSLDPNSARAYAYLAEVLNYAGRPDEAIGFARKAIRLDPNYPPWAVFHLAHSYFQLRRYDEALAALQDALRRGPSFLPARRVLAIVYTELGREKDARAEVAEILRISPGASLDVWRERFPYKHQADLERVIAGLRKAGLK